MRDLLLSLALCLVAIFCVPTRFDARAVTAAEAFAKAPARVFPTIDSLTRLDMIDYFNSGSPKASRNLLRGDCRVTAISESRLEFSSSDVSEHSIEMLPAAKGDTIIMLISTIRTPAEDSRVRFFTTSWRELDGVMKEPTLSDWLSETGDGTLADVENAVPFILARAYYDASKAVLSLTFRPEEYLPEEALPTARDGIRGSLGYRWDGKHMKLLK